MKRRLFFQVVLIILLLSCPAWGHQKNVRTLMEAGFAECQKKDFAKAEEDWANGLEILKKQTNTEKAQADYLVRMGEMLRKFGQSKAACNKFVHALLLYRSIADVQGQEACLAAFKDLSCAGVSLLGTYINTEPTPPENRIKLDKTGHMVGKPVDKSTHQIIEQAKRPDPKRSTDCYEILSANGALIKYPHLSSNVYQYQQSGNLLVEGSNLSGLLRQFQELKKKMDSKKQKDLIETIDLITDQLALWISLAKGESVFIHKGAGEIYFPGTELLKVIVNGLAQKGIELSNCGWSDGYDLSFSILDPQKELTHGYAWAISKKGYERIKTGRWKGGYQIKEGGVFLPGFQCFAADSEYITIDSGVKGAKAKLK